MTQLEQTRRELNITQQELADFVGVSRYTVYRWETGECEPSKQNKERLQEYFQRKAQEPGTKFYVAKTEQPLTAKEYIFSLSAETSVQVQYTLPEVTRTPKMILRKILHLFSIAFLSLTAFCSAFFSYMCATYLKNTYYSKFNPTLSSSQTLIPFTSPTLVLGIISFLLCSFLLVVQIIRWRKYDLPHSSFGKESVSSPVHYDGNGNLLS